MNFNFGEAVKLAAKGFKPSDIAELKELDENKFNKEDILSLISNGYTKAEVKKLVETFGSSEDEHEDETGGAEDDRSGKPEKGSEHEDHVSEDSGDKDDIDYKELYEKEKKLRESIQHKNAAAGSGGQRETKTSEQIAIEIAEMF